MSVGEVLNRGAIVSVFVRVILSCVFESSRELVAAQVGMASFFANLFLSSVFTDTDMIDLSSAPWLSGDSVSEVSIL